MYIDGMEEPSEQPEEPRGGAYWITLEKATDEEAREYVRRLFSPRLKLDGIDIFVASLYDYDCSAHIGALVIAIDHIEKQACGIYEVTGPGLQQITSGWFEFEGSVDDAANAVYDRLTTCGAL